MFPIELGKLARVIGGRIVRGNPNLKLKHGLYQRTSPLPNHGVVFLRLNTQTGAKELQRLQPKPTTAVVVKKGLEHRVPRTCAVITVHHVMNSVRNLIRRERSRSRAAFIGITGSCGKTTTKEMTAVVLSRRFRTLKTIANYNVASMLPFNLIRLRPDHQAVILEMGMSSLGNIRRQCEVAKPHIGIVTNVGVAHVGSLGGKRSNVVRAKQELVDGVRPGGTLIINADDKGTRKLNTRRFRGKIITYGVRNRAHLQAGDIQYTRQGMSFRVKKKKYEIPLWGEHNVYNALAAIALARHLGVPRREIRKGLSRFRPPKMRLQRSRGIKNCLLINDAYNANPNSMIAGLKVLKKVAKEKPSVAVLGDMAELGRLSKKGHRRVGKKVAKLNPDYLFTVGPKAKEIGRAAIQSGYARNKVRFCQNRPQKVAKRIKKKVPPGSILYFKASRKTKLEQTVKLLKK
ncbi:UDP-N-acetylmuramoyl-tripeptide--D-alanyl-D-alanine ligase [Melghirimyces profundicolus]|uniref:UDP-N-acetylmuramoyl-tripeptide--D-alanyl-D-alanine ligase n=1 Tax=Melghirimyces profundicolus TaxID=1242148 RepID=A0A2T6BG95_9BACL|nr:UDP-N-acetylmuramoyl-tripeptide--D-alanyl-D-alanine ligase [Melghirimyces profundicolus]PTX55061.1 UDP-N-acetylmuramoyl-tripeptide--D-alanyl-D-alanine ligase [Melghirimyces profundicolus]